MAQQAKGLAAKHDDQSLVPRTHVVGENWLLQAVLQPLHSHSDMHVQAHTHMCVYVCVCDLNFKC